MGNSFLEQPHLFMYGMWNICEINMYHFHKAILHMATLANSLFT